MRRVLVSWTVAAWVGLVASAPAEDPAARPAPKGRFGPAYIQEPYGQMPDGSPVTQYTLINRNNVRLVCIDYGCIITEWHAPDRNGKMADVVLGCGSLADYRKGHPFFGTNAGRCANRIANARFELDGKTYRTTVNNLDKHTLHGGKEGFDKKLWRAEPFLQARGPGVSFTATSKDGEDGFPGQLATTIAYTLTDDNELVIDIRATTTKPTLCNIAHHSYFNLAGHDAGTIEDHLLELRAARYTPTDAELIPTGAIEPVAGTPLDFTQPRRLGQHLRAVGGQPKGYDLNYVLDGGRTPHPRLVARVVEPNSGRCLELLTTEPGLQLYTGNFLDGQLTGKGGVKYPQYAGFCLEAQRFPDAIHHPQWHNVSNPILRPGEVYQQTTIYKLSVVK